MPTSEILVTAEAIIMGMQKAITDFRKGGDLEAVADLGIGVLTMEVITKTLKARREVELQH